jgi:hypothetical protein
VGGFITSFNRCHVGQLERFTLSDKWRIADLLQFIESAIEADKDLRAASLNGTRRG